MIKKILLSALALFFVFGVNATTTVSEEEQSESGTIDLNPTDLFEQYNLGRTYMEGSSELTKNEELGLKWMEKAATAGLADAQLLAGLCRYNGIGCEPDMTQAMKWLHAAAAQDHPYAIFTIGTICANTEPTDWDSAIKWFKKAADLGLGKAKTELAICYINGLGTDVDYARAAELLEDAVKEEIPDAYFYLGMLYRHGAGVAKDEIKSNLLMEKAASLGQEDAKKILKKQDN